MKHNIKINVIDGKYFFELWYCGKQEMGRSKSYSSRSSCIDGINNFKKWIKQNDVNDEGNFLKITKINDKGFIYQFIDDDNNILYSSRIIENRNNCKKSMISTCKNITKAKLK